uniref:Chromosome 14 open reading frame 93 n=1 Tax=Leptobrachium leishanense TaxID=445787 RepID=A0A8C5MFX3_9ANUR
MSFSATILFTPPSGQNDAKSGCKNESIQAGTVHVEGVTPVPVTGQGVAVQGCEQLLHLIYQRMEKAIGLAETALNVAKANGNLLNSLQEEVTSLRKLCEKPERAKTPPFPTRCKTPDEEEIEEIGGVQVVIEELRQLGAASASLVSGLHTPPMDRTSREGCLPSVHPLGENTPLLSPMHVPGIDDFLSQDASAPRILASNFVKQLNCSRAHGDATELLNEIAPPVLKSALPHLLIQKDGSISPGGLNMGDNSSGTGDIRSPTSPSMFSHLYTGGSSRQRNNGQKCSRRKRDLVLSKLVHNIHNHISNNKRFNGSESIKSSWNISVLKFLVEKLKQELVSSIHHYTDKELKGACVAYFLTKRREYRNSMNPFKSLKEKEEKKLRSRRYRLFANRSWGIQQFPVDDQALWEGVTEELMSDEEDSLSEPGVWVARPPRFRSVELSRLCYRIDSHSKHGTKTNRVYGALSDRLPSPETQLLPPHLYNPDWESEEHEEVGELEGLERGTKSFCPDLNSFIQIKVEKDE